MLSSIAGDFILICLGAAGLLEGGSSTPLYLYCVFGGLHDYPKPLTHPLELIRGVAEDFEIDNIRPELKDLLGPVAELDIAEVFRNDNEVNVTGQQFLVSRAAAEHEDAMQSVAPLEFGLKLPQML
jgi:hypothetical protein